MKPTFFIILILILTSCSNGDKKDVSLIDSSFQEVSITKRQTSIDTIKQQDSIKIIKSPYTDTVLLKVKVYEKDWWEDIYLVLNDRKTTHLPVALTSQSVLSAKFVDLKVHNSIFFEVYEITHQGNGYYNLFEFKNGLLKNILNIRAVDRNQEGYGVTADSAFIFKDDVLISEYLDLNGDGYQDIRFKGIGYVICGDMITDEEKLTLKDPILLERQFLWDNQTHKFVELIKKRKGFWYYDKYGVDY